MDAGQDVEYTATFEVFPTVEVNEIDDLSIEKPVAEVTDADIDDIVEIFRKQQGKLVNAERAAAEGLQQALRALVRNGRHVAVVGVAGVDFDRAIECAQPLEGVVHVGLGGVGDVEPAAVAREESVAREEEPAARGRE